MRHCTQSIRFLGKVLSQSRMTSIPIFKNSATPMPDTYSLGRILAVEDDPLLARHLGEHFQRRGFDITVRANAEDFLALAGAGDVALILMDIMLPDDNGLRLLHALRQQCRVPVILMSALGAEQDRIIGFSQGADDYLPKPFSMGELDARVDAVLRRVAYERMDPQRPLAAQPAPPADIQVGDAWVGLTSIESRLMQVLQQHAGKVLSKVHLYQQVLHRPYSQQDRVLDLHVSHVRRKLAAAGWPGRVDTVWGEGYVLVAL
jgi:two-component system response regulator PfeR